MLKIVAMFYYYWIFLKPLFYLHQFLYQFCASKKIDEKTLFALYPDQRLSYLKL